MRGVADYRFSRKNNWRRTIWNEVRRRVDPGDALVLYLAGPQDADRRVATSKGFRPENLIAVEADAKRAKELPQPEPKTVTATLSGPMRSDTLEYGHGPIRSRTLTSKELLADDSDAIRNMTRKIAQAARRNIERKVWS